LIATAHAQPTPEQLIALTTDIRNEDLQQDTIVALLEARPVTVEEAQVIATRARHRHEWRMRQERKRTMTIETEPSAGLDDRSAISDELRSVLDGLDAPNRELLYFRYIANMSAQEVGAKLGISQPTLRKRTDKAIAAAQDIVARGFQSSVLTTP
jgi:RNA polymerase sigma factor (sigma-70 family)